MNPAALQAALRGDLANAIVASTPGGIEAQEAAGQASLVACNSQLPKEGNEDREAISAATGIQFGKDVDDLFISVTLPAGWRLSATSHSMHNDLLDADGVARAGIFYKAAFYDRRADIRWLPRYHVHTDFDNGTEHEVTARDRKTGAILKSFGSWRESEHGAWREKEKQAGEWLSESYPDYKSDFAYW